MLKSTHKNYVCFAILSTDTLWDLAAAEVLHRERGAGGEDGGGDGGGGGGEEAAVSERTIFIVGSKAGVCHVWISCTSQGGVGPPTRSFTLCISP